MNPAEVIAQVPAEVPPAPGRRVDEIVACGHTRIEVASLENPDEYVRSDVTVVEVLDEVAARSGGR